MSPILLTQVDILLLEYRTQPLFCQLEQKVSCQGEDGLHKQHQHITSQQGEQVPQENISARASFRPPVFTRVVMDRCWKTISSAWHNLPPVNVTSFHPPGSPAARRCVVRLTSQTEGSEVNNVKAVDIGAAVSDRDLRLWRIYNSDLWRAGRKSLHAKLACQLTNRVQKMRNRTFRATVQKIFLEIYQLSTSQIKTQIKLIIR